MATPARASQHVRIHAELDAQPMRVSQHVRVLAELTPIPILASQWVLIIASPEAIVFGGPRPTEEIDQAYHFKS